MKGSEPILSMTQGLVEAVEADKEGFEGGFHGI